MKLKLDESLPLDARAAAEAAGHEVASVVDEGLGGASDPDVLQAAVHEDRLLVTLDRGFGDVRRYPPGTHQGVVVLRMDNQQPSAVVQALAGFLKSQDLDDLRGCIVVVRGNVLRVRRPD